MTSSSIKPIPSMLIMLDDYDDTPRSEKSSSASSLSSSLSSSSGVYEAATEITSTTTTTSTSDNEGIRYPGSNDVLCGRSGGRRSIRHHVGNQHWRLLIQQNKELYRILSKEHQWCLSHSIVLAFRSQTPAGRFLQQDTTTGLWYDIGEKHAIRKTAQALRENAVPEIRTKKVLRHPLRNGNDGLS